MRQQIEQYRSLPITKSYRGIAVLIVAALLGVSVLFSAIGIQGSLEEIMYGLIVYVPVLYFVLKGNRIAMMILMGLITLEKGYQVLQIGSITPLIWWALIMYYLYRALQVENERMRSSVEGSDKNK